MDTIDTTIIIDYIRTSIEILLNLKIEDSGKDNGKDGQSKSSFHHSNIDLSQSIRTPISSIINKSFTKGMKLEILDNPPASNKSISSLNTEGQKTAIEDQM